MTRVEAALKRARLYALVDLSYVASGHEEFACAALLEGGADIIQLRAKNRPTEEIARVAARLIPLCRQAGVPFLVNDFSEIAVRVGADGAHVGQDDGALEPLRASGLLAGRSTHAPEQALAAMVEGFDYIGFGPLHATPTKPGRPAIGLGDIRQVREADPDFPVFCIGGINEETVEAVLRAGGDRIVVVSALLQARDIAAETRRFRKMLS